MGRHTAIPKSWPVQPMKQGHSANPSYFTCGDCGLTWDDSKITSMTPTPSGRCPFENFHNYGSRVACINERASLLSRVSLLLRTLDDCERHGYTESNVTGLRIVASDVRTRLWRN